MGLFEQFPYTNFHELNLDWVLKEWAEQKREFETIAEAFADLKSYVENYFENLDVQDEIDAKLDEMMSEGQLTDVLMQAIAIYEGSFQQQINALSSRMDSFTHLTDGSTTGDAELIDARIGWKGRTYSSAGNAIRGQVTDLEDGAEYVTNKNEFDGYALPGQNASGIILTWNSTSRGTITGTSNAAITFNIFEDTTAFPGAIIPGDIITVNFSSTNSLVSASVYTFDGANYVFLAGSIKGPRQMQIPSGHTGFLYRIEGPANQNLSGTFVSTISRGSRLMDLYDGAFPIIAQNSASIPEQTIIKQALVKYGAVYLLPGTHYSNGFTMPANSRVTGAGKVSVLHTTSAGQNGIVIDAPNCTVDNIKLVSTDTISGLPGTHGGVYVLGDNNTWLYNTRITNVTATGFDRGGIVLSNIGQHPINNVTVSDCECYGNTNGIRIESYAEYCSITDCMFVSNYHGAVVQGGNNRFVNCNFSQNTVAGIYLDNGSNNAHGCCVGCMFNHNGNNTGYAVIAKYQGFGWTFTGCNFWYGEFQADQNAYVVIGDSIFGSVAASSHHLTSYNGSLILVNNCLWTTAPDIVGGSTAIKMSDCYQTNGTAVTV